MTVTELATITLIAGSNVADAESNAGRIWQSICATISRQPNFEGLFYGHEVESPDVVQLFVNWHTLQDHENFKASPDYAPMIAHLQPIMEGTPHFVHYTLPTPASTASLATALSAPVTELATFFLAAQTESFQGCLEKFAAAVSEERPDGFVGVATAWSVEEVEHEGFGAGEKGKAVLLAIGWRSVEAHMAYRETEHFKSVVGLLRGEPKGVELHHATIQAR